MRFEPGISEFLEFEKRRWPEVVGAYHRLFEPVTGRVAGPLLDAAGAGSGSRVLDVATGPGYVARAAAAAGATVVGLDFSHQVIALAAALSPGVDFVVGDAHDLPFADSKFDSVVANFLLPHLGDHLRGVSELARVTKDRGRVAVSNWDLPEGSPLTGLIQGALRSAGASPPPGIPVPPPLERYSSFDGMAALLEEGGLREVSVSRLRFDHHIDTAQDLWNGVIEGTVRTSVVLTSQTPEVFGRIRKAFGELCARYLKGDELVLPVSVLVGSGTKS